MADIEKTTAPSEKKEKPAKAKKDKVPFGKRIATWLRSYKSEFKKIVWTSPKAVFSNSVLVIIAIIAFAAVIGLLDLIFVQGIDGLSRLI